MARRRTWRSCPTARPLIVFSHSPLYKLYKTWNFWTDDADEVQAILQAVQARGGDPRPHAPVADQPDRQHPLPRPAVDRLAVAVRPGGDARADHPDEPSRPVQPQRRLRRRRGARASRRAGRQGLQPVEPESGHRRQGLHGELGQGGRSARSQTGRATNTGTSEANKEIRREPQTYDCASALPCWSSLPDCYWACGRAPEQPAGRHGQGTSPTPTWPSGNARIPTARRTGWQRRRSATRSSRRPTTRRCFEGEQAARAHLRATTPSATS